MLQRLIGLGKRKAIAISFGSMLQPEVCCGHVHFFF